MLPTSVSEKVLSRAPLDVPIRVGLIAVLTIFCFEIVLPFVNLIVWSVILAVTLYRSWSAPGSSCAVSEPGPPRSRRRSSPDAR